MGAFCALEPTLGTYRKDSTEGTPHYFICIYRRRRPLVSASMPSWDITTF